MWCSYIEVADAGDRQSTSIVTGALHRQTDISNNMANFRSIAVALVPGMNSLASSTFIPLAKNLTTYGKVEVIDLPSVGANETKVSLKPNALQADIDSIHDCLSRVIDEGFDVFVVAHAYGGTPALYACEGLWKSQNPIAGVLGVGLIASSLTLPGKSVAEMRTDWDKVHARVSDGAVQMEVVDDVSSGVQEPSILR